MDLFSDRPRYITDACFKTLSYRYVCDIPRSMLVFDGYQPVEREHTPEEGEKEVKNTVFLAGELRDKCGVLFHHLPKRRQLAVVLIDPRRESEARNHQPLTKALESLIAPTRVG